MISVVGYFVRFFKKSDMLEYQIYNNKTIFEKVEYFLLQVFLKG